MGDVPGDLGIATQPTSARRPFDGDRRWLAVMAVLIVVEVGWWASAWRAGLAPVPLVGTYLGFAVAALAAASVVRLAARARSDRSGWAAVAAGTILTGLGASLFLPLKYAIPQEVALWLDGPLAAAERALFGGDPWRLLDRLLGWALVPVDRVYALWLPVQALVLFAVMLEAPSPAKSRALIAYSLAWLGLGVVAATLCSSVGPIFYDRMFGGSDFASLGEALRARGATMAIAESDIMWSAYANRSPGLVAGMSAMPSLHVAISLWIWLAARTMAPRLAAVALTYVAFMWLASVQLGWHYVGDGLAGALGMLALWVLAARIDRWLGRLSARRSKGAAAPGA